MQKTIVLHLTRDIHHFRKPRERFLNTCPLPITLQSSWLGEPRTFWLWDCPVDFAVVFKWSKAHQKAPSSLSSWLTPSEDLWKHPVRKGPDLKLFVCAVFYLVLLYYPQSELFLRASMPNHAVPISLFSPLLFMQTLLSSATSSLKKIFISTLFMSRKFGGLLCLSTALNRWILHAVNS